MLKCVACSLTYTFISIIIILDYAKTSIYKIKPEAFDRPHVQIHQCHVQIKFVLQHWFAVLYYVGSIKGAQWLLDIDTENDF